MRSTACTLFNFSPFAGTKGRTEKTFQLHYRPFHRATCVVILALCVSRALLKSFSLPESMEVETLFPVWPRLNFPALSRSLNAVSSTFVESGNSATIQVGPFDMRMQLTELHCLVMSPVQDWCWMFDQYFIDKRRYSCDKDTCFCLDCSVVLK